MINTFIENNSQLCIVMGIALFIRGIVLAYFTDDMDPWGTVGGFISGVGLIFGLYAWDLGRKKNK